MPVDESRAILPISLFFISLFLTHYFAEALVTRFVIFAWVAVIFGVEWQKKLFSREKSIVVVLAGFILYYFPLSWIGTGDNISPFP